MRIWYALLLVICWSDVSYGRSSDFDGNGVVGFQDLFMFGDAFGTENADFDLDGNGLVDLNDFEIFTASFSNKIPIASAREDKVVNVGDVVLLDGSNSSDPDNQMLTYSWSSSEIGIVNSEDAEPYFIADPAGSYTITLVVNDGLDDSKTDKIIVDVVSPPTANASAEPSFVAVGGEVILKAEAEVNQIYHWSQSDNNPASVLFSANQSEAFLTKINLEEAGRYYFSLLVENENGIRSEPDSVSVIAVAGRIIRVNPSDDVNHEIRAATQDDIIVLEEGTYTDEIDLVSNTTLIGADRDKTILSNPGGIALRATATSAA